MRTFPLTGRALGRAAVITIVEVARAALGIGSLLALAVLAHAALGA